MAPGTRVVSNSFDMSEWTPDETAHVTDGCTGYCRAYLWIVPAKVGGTWQLGSGELTLQQDYQFFTGLLSMGNVVAPIKDGKLNGDRITFSAGDVRYTGQVKGGKMEGTSVAAGKQTTWTAARK
jgi:hypothetical protein